MFHEISGSNELQNVKSSFRAAAERLAALAGQAGFSVVPYNDRELQGFSSLPFGDQIAAANEINRYVEILSEAQPISQDMSYNRRAVWAMVKQMGFVLKSDVFEVLEDDDIIEIWSVSGKQIFRSFHALKFWSYTLEDLYVYPFYELFEREEAHHSAYLAAYDRVLRGEIDETIWMGVPRHLVRERLSRKRYGSWLTPKYVSPLRDKTGQLVGFFHSCRAERE